MEKTVEKTVEKFDLISLWSKDKDTIAKEAAKGAFDELRIDAESVIIKRKNVVRATNANFKKTIENAKNGTNFNEILTASLAVKEATLAHEEGVELYKLLFDENPALS